MTTKETRARHTRRDRRKAKASGWAREGQANPRKVGHGGSGQGTMGYLGPAPEPKPKSKSKPKPKPEPKPEGVSIRKFIRQLREKRLKKMAAGNSPANGV